MLKPTTSGAHTLQIASASGKCQFVGDTQSAQNCAGHIVFFSKHYCYLLLESFPTFLSNNMDSEQNGNGLFIISKTLRMFISDFDYGMVSTL